MSVRDADRFDEQEYELLAPVIAAVAQDPEANRLCAALALTEGFQFDVVVCPTPRHADALLAWLAVELPKRRGHEAPFERLRPNRHDDDAGLTPTALTANILSQLDANRLDRGAEAVIVIDATGYRSDELAAWRWFFQRCNERRNRIAAIVAVPLLFLLPPELDSTFASQAPDLWSIRSLTVRLSAADIAIPRSALYSSHRFEPIALERARATVTKLRAGGESQHPLELASALRRLAEEELDHDHLTEATAAVHELALLRATIDDPLECAKIDRVDANVQLRLGDGAQALTILSDRVLPIIEQHGSMYQRALTYRAFADALTATGDLETALRYLRERALPLHEQLRNDHGRAEIFSDIANILAIRGDLDEALRLRKEIIPTYEQFGDVRSKAVTQAAIADILLAKGQLDESLRLLSDEVLPVYERLGDLRGKAVTQAQIADILFSRGQVVDALHVWKDKALPVFEHLGDVRSRAVTQGRIADALQGLGQIDEALRIQRDELLPAFMHLGDVRSKAKTQGRIAGILHLRGRSSEALQILTKEVFPIYEQLGDIRSTAMTRGRIAEILESQGNGLEALRIWKDEVLPVFERLGDVRGETVAWGMIADILFQQGQLDEALRIRKDVVLPVYVRLDDMWAAAVAKGKIADILFVQGHEAEALQIWRDEALPVYERLGDVRSLYGGLANYAQVLLSRPTVARIAEARNCLQRAKALAERFGLPVSDALRDLFASLSNA